MFLLSVALLSCPASAQDLPTTAPAAAPAKLKVLAKPAKPFVFERAGAMTGYSVDLWRRIAQELELDFEIQPVATVKERKADLGIGALSITAERETVIDFSHPFFESGLQILAPARSDSSILSAFRKMMTAENAKLFGALILGLILISHLLWLWNGSEMRSRFPKVTSRGCGKRRGGRSAPASPGDAKTRRPWD